MENQWVTERNRRGKEKRKGMELGVENGGIAIKMIVPTANNPAKPRPSRVCRDDAGEYIVGGIVGRTVV